MNWELTTINCPAKGGALEDLTGHNCLPAVALAKEGNSLVEMLSQLEKYLK